MLGVGDLLVRKDVVDIYLFFLHVMFKLTYVSRQSRVVIFGKNGVKDNQIPQTLLCNTTNIRIG